MRITEILRLVMINLAQNKFKVILTSIGIVVGSATIMMVLAIGSGSKEEVAEQFKNLNAGAIDITYEANNFDFAGGGGGMPGSGGGMPGGGGAPFSGGSMPGGGGASFGGGMPGGGDAPFGGGMPGFDMNDRINQENITLDTDDVEDLEAFVPDISSATISYSTNSSVEGGDLEEAENYTIAGVKSNYFEMSNLSMAIGEAFTDTDDESKEKTCVLGYSAAKEIFGSVYDAYDQEVYIDSRQYNVAGVLDEIGTVSVKERTNEIGILKALGCSRKDILLEFLMEAAAMSFIGAVLGILLSLAITPLVELFQVRVILSAGGALLSLFFGVVTGSIFGFYPAYKASRLIPVVALNQE